MADDPFSSSRASSGADSTEDALRVLRALSAASTPSRRSLPARRTLMILTIAVPLLLVVGLIVGAEYLDHLANSTIGGGSATLTTTETNLTTALDATERYSANHDHSLDGVTAPAVLVAAAPALTFSSVSGSSTVIAVNQPSPGTLVMTSYQASPPVCFGVLDVVSSQATPVFSSFADTGQTGTFYFEAPSVAELCNAVTVSPPDGGSYVSPTGFPTARLP